MDTHSWHRYVAIGDSLTEGLGDPAGPRGDDRWHGWADRLAVILDGHARLAGERFDFGNLAVRGSRVADAARDQVPRAIDVGADLVSVMIGGNDLMSPAADPDQVAEALESVVARLRASGATVLLANCFDPQFAFFLRPFRGRAAVFNAHVWTIARRHGAAVLDLWGAAEFRRQSMWAEDRVHLSSEGHRALARRASHALGVPYAESATHARSPAAGGAGSTPSHPPDPTLSLPRWFVVHALPWLGRRMRRISSGDGRMPKRPYPAPIAHAGLADGGPH
ncbi:SGNH/GDSL hydrolase family protein [Agromyces sp. SYSU T00194]|uniref:SGNH/GDSL hydrolase family protein n=1 Tax=Agromyces chitinivorans TaxID=3158560 RepID=UPI003392CFE3